MDNNKIFYILFGIITIALLFEIFILAFGFFNADKYECNLLWCTFTYESTDIEQKINITYICYENNIKINCSNIKPIQNICTDSKCIYN